MMLAEAGLAKIASTILEHALKQGFSYALKETTASDRFRRWIGRSPEQIAIQVALARAEATFSRRYPRWSASLFDEHFLTTRAAPMLTECLKPETAPSSRELAVAWAEQVGIRGESRQQVIGELTPVAGDFLSWFRAELHARPEFEKIFDSRALDAIAAHSADAVRATEALRLELRQIFNDLVGMHLISGMATLDAPFSVRVQNFITMYLGSPGQPVPFGGRQAELTQLNEWLDEQSPSPYLMITAPAGRGKSALLVRWVADLLTRSDLAVVFVPVSIRFRTNLASVVFSLLAARLAALHGEKIPSTSSTSTEVWCGLVADYLARPLPDGRTLIVILDGVDEAADWEAGPDLFPLTPPVHLRVVVSARLLANDIDGTAWLQRLAWNRSGLALSLDLARITRDGVADVLHRMGFPLDDLGRRIDIVSELHRLSDGDPLLISLYVEDLWRKAGEAERLQPQDLSRLTPGIAGYFDHWWQDQRRLWGSGPSSLETGVQTVLNLLCCALGPLTQRDVLQLAPPEVGLSTWRLEDALRPLARFVVGDGRQQGYVFSHPKLGMYFYDRLTPEEQKYWQARFLGWGGRVLAELSQGALPPQDAPSYLVQYYGAHLGRNRATAHDLQVLVSDGWRRAWEAYEGAYSGFLNDLDRAWQAAKREDSEFVKACRPPQHLALELRCVLCHASVVSLLENIPPSLIVNLVARGVWTPSQGLAYSRYLPSDVDRVRALQGLAPYVTDALVVQVMAAIAALPKEGWQAEVLIRLASSLHGPLVHEAIDLARTMASAWLRARTLAALAPRVDEIHRDRVWNDALAAIPHIHDGWWRAGVLVEILPSLPTPLIQQLHDAARAIPDPYSRVRSLAGLASPETTSLRDSLLTEALDAARLIERDQDRGQALQLLIPQMPDSLHQPILDLALAMPHLETRIELILSLAPHLSEAGVAYAAKSARRQRRARLRSSALATLMEIISAARTGRTAAPIFEALHDINDKLLRVRILFRMIPHLQDALRDQVAHEALAAVRQIGESQQRSDILIEMAGYLPTQFLPVAFELSETIDSEWHQARAIVGLAPFLPESLLEVASRHALSLHDPWQRRWMIGGLAAHLPDHLLANLVSDAQVIGDGGLRAWASAPMIVAAFESGQTEQAISEADCLPDAWCRALVFEAIASKGTEEARNTIRTKSVAAAREILENSHRVEALLSIARHLPQDSRDAAMDVVLESIRSMVDERERADALLRLEIMLPSSLASRALDQAQSIGDRRTREEVLRSISKCFPVDLRQEALRIADEDSTVILREDDQARSLERSRRRLHSLIMKRLPEHMRTPYIRRYSLDEDTLTELIRHWMDLNMDQEDLREILRLRNEILELEQQAGEGSNWLSDVRRQVRRERAQGGWSSEYLDLLRDSRKIYEMLPGLKDNMVSGIFNDESFRNYRLWTESLSQLAAMPRRSAFENLRELAPKMASLGRGDAVMEAIVVVRDIGTWWP